MLSIDSPKEHQVFKPGQLITFAGTAGPGITSVRLMSPFKRELISLGTVKVKDGKWRFRRAFLVPGQRDVIVDGFDNAGMQKKEAHVVRPFAVKSNFGKPFSVPARITSAFGERRPRFHEGVDMIPADFSGTASIHSVADGVVVDVSSGCRIGDADCGGGFGNRVFVRHEKLGLITRYNHLAKTSVQSGDSITQGQKVGMMGETGAARGIHLHLEFIRISDGLPVDPEDFVIPLA